MKSVNQRRVGAIVVGLAMALGGAGCGLRPDPNAPVRVTGDRDAAIPPTSSTSTTVAPEPTTTTLFYGQGS